MESIMAAAHGLLHAGPVGYAVAGGGSAAALGAGLFNYNRGNFRMDQKLHYSRFVAGHNLAIAQVKQYREDLVDLSTLTCTRMDTFHAVAAMSLTILTALFCPGRLGLHTPAPPSWLMGLFMANLGGCYLFLGLTMWLAMHASMRADTAITHMLTRFVRLPIPSTWMLDRARKFMANYEETSWGEIFRFPLVHHQRADGGDGGFNMVEEMEEDANKRTRHNFDVPLWYRHEKHVDEEGYNYENMVPSKKRGDIPEHFEVYREIQNEWWPYDVYARICVFLAGMHLFHAWGYHQIGHGLQETRAFFAVGTVVLSMFALQQILLTLDIIPSEFPLHRLGPFSLICAYIAGAIDYKRWFDAETQAIGFVFVYIAYAIEIIYTYQLIKLCEPSYDNPPTPDEAAGAAWWPGEWKLPAAFHHAVWLVAPPKHLDPHQHDLAGEMAEVGKKLDGYGNQPQAPKLDEEEKRRDVHNALGPVGESPAWRNVQIGLIAMLIAWVWLTFGFTIEVINQGTTHPALLSAPGLPNYARDPRWRSPKPGREHPVEVGFGAMEHGPLIGERHGEHGAGHGGEHGGGHGESGGEHGGAEHAAEGHGGRRLSASVSENIRALVPHLQHLAAALGSESLIDGRGGLPNTVPMPAPTALAALPPRIAVQWPPLFEPRLVACAPHGRSHPGHHAILLSRYGRGAVVTAESMAGVAEMPGQASAFALEGVGGFGHLLSASWDDSGLLLLTSTGVALECPGEGPTAGSWRCQRILGAKLSLGGAQDFQGAAAIFRQAKDSASLQAAIAFPGEDSIALFSRTAIEPETPWLPIGEARVASSGGSGVVAASFSDAKTLLLSSQRGEVTRMHLGDGRTARVAAAIADQEGYTWHGACGLASGDFARLAVRASGVAVRETMLHVGEGPGGEAAK